VRSLIIFLVADVVFTIACRPIEAVYIVVTWRKVKQEQIVRTVKWPGPDRMISKSEDGWWGLKIPAAFSKTLTPSTWGSSASCKDRHEDLRNTEYLWEQIDALHHCLLIV
tara:strand:- start:505 stop:834 length:330 start_codon:yes stop_codon:yes gene_type:complete